MPRVYFAKFNINEKIYSVYEQKESLTELLNKIFRDINSDVVLNDKDGNYKFISLDKNPDTLVVNGRLVVYAPGTHVSYDPNKDDVVERADDKMATYITFSFDIRREVIGFVPKRDFGRKQFIEKFKNLIEACTNVGEVEIFIESDLEELNAKLQYFKHVKEVSVDLIPPNNDKKEFDSLFSVNSEELKETNGTKFGMRIVGSAKQGINLGAKYLKRLVRGVSLGYGKILVLGKNTSGEDFSISSDDDAPFTRPISEKAKDSIPTIAEKTRAGAAQLLALKAKVRAIESEERKE
ncbi:hypothetical protein NOW01_06905 [Anoxybacillus salavatliensis]|uniref:hypothetical protein n=1 Tax=Anoxybacillus gonensis TaxID=198467 RepID=UPI00214BB4CA|nr:hypothetical protein [Anoxybacillus gonensis]MCQ5364735.1 hypothetical protein [Anoxybacillus gonensis]